MNTVPGIRDDALGARAPAREQPPEKLVSGLRGTPKRLSAAYFYDQLGSALFERICRQPEYYLTRTETAILRRIAPEIGRLLGECCLLVELGSGSSAKTRLLLERLDHPAAYVPVDVCSDALLEAVSALRNAYPRIEVLPACADFTQALTLPRPALEPNRVAFFFPGSTIGNLDTLEAVRLMRRLRALAGAHGALVVGVDLVKDSAKLEAAYNDRAGVTAAFNLNVLRRLNREFGANFALDQFDHEALWCSRLSRIEMRLVSRRRQHVLIADEAIAFEAGERLVTEHCHKYTLDGFAALARAAGWSSRFVWTDDRGDFSIHYLTARAH
jgi:dimethylhistidine N-methyltransferase